MQVKDAIKRLQEYHNPEDEIIFNIWQADDVVACAERLGCTLTLDEIEEVLFRAENGFDANIGINWEVLSVWIHEIIRIKGIQ